MKTYFNMKTAYGTETVDELNSEDLNTLKEYRKEKVRLMSEYHLAGMPVYPSQRCDKTWKD